MACRPGAATGRREFDSRPALGEEPVLPDQPIPVAAPAEPFQARNQLGDQRRDPGQEGFVMQALPGGLCPDLIGDNAKPPERASGPLNGTLLEAPDSRRAGDQPYVTVCARGRSGVPVKFGSRAGHRPIDALRASVRRHEWH
jgi:hypothetical protein